MACLLRIPTQSSKGVITFTTQERDRFILPDPDTIQAVERLKRRWVVGLHHNWHDFDFHYNPLFEFSMADPTDLREADGKPIPFLPLDACNFAPAHFVEHGAANEKLWDVLHVTRPVFFKRLPQFLQCVRKLYDDGHKLRILCVAPMPVYHWQSRNTVYWDIRQQFESMFSLSERKLFTLLTPDHDQPFPLDLQTLGFLYRSSRAFVHFANDERRCRVASYAWCTGIPVVAMDSVGSLLPPELRRPPYFYNASSDADFPSLIVRAVEESKTRPSFEAPRRQLSEVYTRDTLLRELAPFLKVDAGTLRKEDFALEQLDIRLGRHHEYTASGNSVRFPIPNLVDFLDDESSAAALAEAIEKDDPEEHLARRVAAQRFREKRSVILKRAVKVAEREAVALTPAFVRRLAKKILISQS